jgi:hypothetical protein
LQAQLWTRPLGAESRLKFRPLGTGAAISATLIPDAKLGTYSTRISAIEVLATATFLLVPATDREKGYVVTQVRVYDARTNGLIAECAAYSSLSETSPGTGVCSGVIGPNQFGLTLSKTVH